MNDTHLYKSQRNNKRSHCIPGNVGVEMCLSRESKEEKGSESLEFLNSHLFR